LHSTPERIPAVCGLAGVVKLVREICSVIGMEHLAARPSKKRIVKEPEDPVRVPVCGNRGRDGRKGECLWGLGSRCGGDESRAARVKGKGLHVVGGISSLSFAAEIEVPVP